MKKIIKILFTNLILIFGSNSAYACMCGSISVCDAYQQAGSVIIGKITKIENPKPDEKNGYNDRQISFVNIEKSFKGDNEKVIKIYQENSTCDWWFENEDLNKKYLFYLTRDKLDKLKYLVISCGRSTVLTKASDDLSWLNGLPNSANRTRISGVTSLRGDDFPSISNINLKVSGMNKIYEVKTNKDGLYEIWDIKPGKYSIIPTIPDYLNLSWTVSVPENWTYFWSTSMQDQNALNTTVQPRNCGGIDFMFEEK